MLVANALRKSDVAIPSKVVSYTATKSLPLTQSEKRDIDILNLFHNDKRAGVAPYSIQNVADVGLKDFGVYPGQWYGINTASLIIESLEQRYRPIADFRICTFQDGNISLPKLLQAGCCDQEAVLGPSAAEFADGGIGASQLDASQVSFDFDAARRDDFIGKNEALAMS